MFRSRCLRSPPGFICQVMGEPQASVGLKTPTAFLQMQTAHDHVKRIVKQSIHYHVHTSMHLSSGRHVLQHHGMLVCATGIAMKPSSISCQSQILTSSNVNCCLRGSSPNASLTSATSSSRRVGASLGSISWEKWLATPWPTILHSTFRVP